MQEIRDIAVILAKELSNALRNEFGLINHDRATNDLGFSSNCRLRQLHERKPKSIERAEENPSISEILGSRRTSRMRSRQIEEWYEEISRNPWRTIISEKGVNGL